MTQSIKPGFEALVKSLKRIAFSVARNRKRLEHVRELDRDLVKLTHMRERALGLLTQSFIESPMAEKPPTEFQWIMTEISNIERERSQPSQSTTTSLSALVIPTVGAVDGARQDDLELMTEVERSELYRRRLRGLYLDLAEMILSHRVSDHFPTEKQHIDAVQSRLTRIREIRQNVQATLPGSVGFFSAVKVFAVIGIIALTVWVLM